MKLVKLSVFALTLGLFVVSCGSGSGEASSEPATEETMEAPEAEAVPEAMPAEEAAPATDSTATPATEEAPATEAAPAE